MILVYIFDRDCFARAVLQVTTVVVILFLVIDSTARWRGAVAVKLRLDSLMLLSFVNIAEIVCFLSREYCHLLNILIIAQLCYNC